MAHAQSSSTSGPAFDCQRASTPVEMLICRDQELAAMDVDLARAYRAALDALQGDNRRRLIAEENEWIRSRATCAKAADMRACVERAYTQRLNQLRR